MKWAFIVHQLRDVAEICNDPNDATVMRLIGLEIEQSVSTGPTDKEWARWYNEGK